MPNQYEIRRMEADEFFHDEVPYIDALGLLDFMEKVAFQRNLLLVGPTGMAKTMAVYALAQKLGYPVIPFDCAEDSESTDIVGTFGVQGDSTYFSLGPAPTAIEVANEMFRDKDEEADGAIFLINEINALPPTTQKTLNPMLDFQKSVAATAIGRLFRLEGAGTTRAKLWVVAGMNPSAYGGTHALNADLRRRFMVLNMGYPSDEQEIAILKGLDTSMVGPGGIDKKVLDETVSSKRGFIEQLVKLAGQTRKDSTEYSLSPADLHEICRDVSIFGVPKALRIAADKFENPNDFKFFVSSVQATMGIDLGKVTVLDAPTSIAAPNQTKSRRRRKSRKAS